MKSMGRIQVKLNRGPWTPQEDLCLTNYIQSHGEGRWRSLSKKAGLLRCGKSCRLRWMNYLRPDVKRGHILPDEEDLILRLHRLLGNRWSLIAGRLPGRTDNDVKNYWNCHLSKKLISQGIDPRTHRPLSESEDIWWIPQDCNTDQNDVTYTISGINDNQEKVNAKDSDCAIAGTKEDRIFSSVAVPEISCSQNAPIKLPSASVETSYMEMSKSNGFDFPKQITDGSWFPYFLPPTPMGTSYGNGSSYMNPSFLESFLNENSEVGEPSVGYNYVSQQSELASPGYELWSALHSPNTNYRSPH